MPAKEILVAIRELEAAGWRIRLTHGHGHAYAMAYCPGGARGCRPFMINSTPRVAENEAARMRRALTKCPHRRTAMNVYWFDVEISGPVTLDDAESLGDVLTAAEGIDASVQADERGGIVMFSRGAEDAIQAVVSAVRDVEAAGMKVTGVVEDRVTAAGIADKARVTTAAVRYWISGERGPGNFPAPVVRRERASMYSWAEVAAWLAWAKLGQIDHVAAETARACLIIDAALTVRNGLRDLPRHNQPLIRELVA